MFVLFTSTLIAPAALAVEILTPNEFDMRVEFKITAFALEVDGATETAFCENDWITQFSITNFLPARKLTPLRPRVVPAPLMVRLRKMTVSFTPAFTLMPLVPDAKI